jgi:2',3'-cyclic-nucleotide 2'-phosphodiesterase (5'-nucleotidase family)
MKQLLLYTSKITLRVIALTLSAVACVYGKTNDPAANLTILHMNDMHARITPHHWIVPSHQAPVAQPFELVGGAASFTTKLLERKKAYPDALVIDCGDVSEGNPLGDMGGNSSMVQFYKLLDRKLKTLGSGAGRGIDAIVVGNHDVRFHSYIDNLTALDQATGGHVISVNICRHGTLTPYFHPYVVLTVRGIKIGLVGYTTNTTVIGDDLLNTIDLAPVDWKSADPTRIHMADYVNQLRNNVGCDLVFLVSHAGHTELCAADAPVLQDDGNARVPEVAVTGHWHTWTDTVWQPEILNYKTIFTESGSYVHYLGELHVDATGRFLSTVEYPITNSNIDPDPDVAALIDRLKAQYAASNPPYGIDQIIGYSADDLLLDKRMKWWSGDEYPWDGDNTAGQWICDSVQWKAQQLFGECDLSIEAGGGVRSDVPAGPIRYTDIYETFPWPDDVIYLVRMTGQEIYDYFKLHGCDVGFSRGWFVTAQDGVPVSITQNGQPIDPGHTYKVAINNYMYEHDSVPFSDPAPLTSTYLARQAILDYTQQFTQNNPMEMGGLRYSFDTEFSGGYRAVVMMMNDADSKPQFEDAFVRFLSATPETLIRRGTSMVPADLVNADGTINHANRLSENELYRSFLGFKTGALHPGDIIETYGKGSFYRGNPEFVDQEGVYGDGIEFRIVGHDDSLAQPAYMPTVQSFWNSTYKNHYVKFFARKAATSSVRDNAGTLIPIMDATAYAAKALPGNTGDLLQLTGVTTSENFALRFRCDRAVLASSVGVTGYPPESHIDPVAPIQTTSPLELTAEASAAGIEPTIYTISPSDDSYVAKGQPDTTHGTSTTTFVSSAATGGFQDERGWFKFNLSSIPPGSTISSATLNLYCWGAAGVSLPAELRSADDTWTTAGLTWNNQPPIGDALDNVTLNSGAVNVWYSWNATSSVQTEFSGDKVVSLLIKPVTEGSTDPISPTYRFDSSRWSNPAQRPYLEVRTAGGAGAPVLTRVQFFYRYSMDHQNWNSWSVFQTDTSSPWTATFSYPNGDGYYEFYSVATDSNGMVEPAPPYADTGVYYNHISFAPASVHSLSQFIHPEVTPPFRAP